MRGMGRMFRRGAVFWIAFGTEDESIARASSRHARPTRSGC